MMTATSPLINEFERSEVKEAESHYTSPPAELDVYFMWKGVIVYKKDENGCLRDIKTGQPVRTQGKYLTLGRGWQNMEFHLGDGAVVCGMHPRIHGSQAIAGRGLEMAWSNRDEEGLMKNIPDDQTKPLEVVVNDEAFLPAARLMLEKYG